MRSRLDGNERTDRSPGVGASKGTLKMMKTYPTRQWPEIYVDWINNFLSISKFAQYYGISEDYASNIIDVGRMTDNFSICWPRRGY